MNNINKKSKIKELFRILNITDKNKYIPLCNITTFVWGGNFVTLLADDFDNYNTTFLNNEKITADTIIEELYDSTDEVKNMIREITAMIVNDSDEISSEDAEELEMRIYPDGKWEWVKI